MADEQTEQVVVDAKPLEDKPKAYQGVISKPEHTLPPYHTEETAKIAEDRAKDVAADKDKPYEYTVNGYTVKARKAEEQEAGMADAEGFVYDVDGNELQLRTYGNKRDAEIFVETHSPMFAKQSATMPSA